MSNALEQTFSLVVHFALHYIELLEVSDVPIQKVKHIQLC